MHTLKAGKSNVRLRPYLGLSVLCYALSLLLPVYQFPLNLSDSLPSDYPNVFMRGWECLLSGYAAWAPWSANFMLAITWITIIFWKRWCLVPAASTAVLAGTIIAMDPDP